MHSLSAVHAVVYFCTEVIVCPLWAVSYGFLTVNTRIRRLWYLFCPLMHQELFLVSFSNLINKLFLIFVKYILFFFLNN